MRRRTRKPRCPHTEIDEIYDERAVVEDAIAGIGSTEYFGHCRACDQDVSWTETL